MRTSTTGMVSFAFAFAFALVMSIGTAEAGRGRGGGGGGGHVVVRGGGGYGGGRVVVHHTPVYAPGRVVVAGRGPMPRYYDRGMRPALINEYWAPRPGFYWLPGRWDWGGAEWVWYPGHYEPDPNYAPVRPYGY